MTFEEKFPELMKCNDNTSLIEDVEKHCLSKQRVREIIQKVNEEFSDNKYASEDYPGADTICDEILKELEL